jgi:ubiquinone/menaquinone biosynthesis C-methylase UbiE
VANDYIHSFTAQEQQRLIDQALFLEPYHHPGLDLRGCRRVLEVGCGVGAQMSVLLRRWPEAHVSGVDRSDTQLDRARQTLSAALAEGRAELHLAAGDHLPFADNAFDAVCVFWVFEHVNAPMPILSEIRRVLRPGAPFYATEVFDKGLYMYPAGAATAAYFRAFTALQAEFGGDPDIGVRMAGLLAQAGFVDVAPTDVSPTLDARMTDASARGAFLEYFQTLLLSGADALLARGRIAAETVGQVKAEFAALQNNPASVFTYGAKQVCGRKPAA